MSCVFNQTQVLYRAIYGNLITVQKFQQPVDFVFSMWNETSLSTNSNENHTGLITEKLSLWYSPTYYIYLYIYTYIYIYIYITLLIELLSLRREMSVWCIAIYLKNCSKLCIPYKIKGNRSNQILQQGMLHSLLKLVFFLLQSNLAQIDASAA